MLAIGKQIFLSRSTQINSWANWILQEQQLRNSGGWLYVQNIFIKQETNAYKAILI